MIEAHTLRFLQASSIAERRAELEATPPAMANLLKAVLFHRMHGMLHQHIDDRFLEGSRHVCLDNGTIFSSFAAVDIVQNGGLQAAEAEIIGRICHFCPGESDGVWDFPL